MKEFLDADIPGKQWAVACLHRSGFAIVQVVNESSTL